MAKRKRESAASKYVQCAGWDRHWECDCENGESFTRLAELKNSGWTEVENDVTPGFNPGWIWTHLGLCPECTVRKLAESPSGLFDG